MPNLRNVSVKFTAYLQTKFVGTTSYAVLSLKKGSQQLQLQFHVERKTDITSVLIHPSLTLLMFVKTKMV